MHKPLAFSSATILTASLLTLPPALAQSAAQSAAVLDQIQVVGASDLLANFLKASLQEQPGQALSQVNPKAVEQEALATGFFKTATAELRPENGQQVLVVTVVPNPEVAAVTVTGAEFVPADQIKTFLSDNLNIAPGATLNTARVEDSRRQLQQAYRQAGLPFSPAVSAQISETKTGATVAYTVSETAPVKRVEVTGAGQLSADTIRAAFQPLVNGGNFSAPLYQQAVQAIADAYGQQGLRGSVDAGASSLQNGTLKVVVRELRVGSVDTGALGSVNVPLASKPGELFKIANVSADVRALSNATGKAVGTNYLSDPNDPARVNVAFVPGDQATGPIKEVRIAGATVVPVADLAKALKERLGDVYTPQLAQEDYLNLQQVYRARGFEILTTPDPISFQGGVLTFHVREARLAGYQLRWQGGHNTSDRVVLRELPDAGGVLNTGTLRQAVVNRIGRLGFVVPVGEQFVPDPQDPQQVTYVLTLQEKSGNSFSPGFSYDTLSGASGDVSLSGNNLFGLGHSYSASLSANPSTVGEYLSLSASYTIPWLDFDFLDFRRNRTSLSLSAYTQATPKLPIVDPATGGASGRTYTTRATGFGVGLGRALTPTLSASVNVTTQYSHSALEPLAVDNPTLPSDPADPNSAENLTPRPGLTTVFGVGLAFDDVNYPDFPTSGQRATANAGYGFGREGDTPLSWTQYDAGGRTYLGFGQTLPDGNRQQAVAARVNAGTLVGNAPASRYFNVGGSDPSERFTLLGYDANRFNGPNFFTSSVEYRYNFNVNTSFSQGLYGVAFVNVGDAWGAVPNDFAMHFGYGVGVQVNLGIGSFLLPALRFDYAFSPENPRGRFFFRLGNFF